MIDFRPTSRTPLAARRITIGIAVSWASLIVLVAVMLPFRNHVSIAASGLVLVIPVVLGVAVGGFFAGVVSVVTGFFVYVFFFIPPYYTFYIGGPQNWAPLGVYFVVMLLVARVVASLVAARRRFETKADEYERLAENASDVVFEVDVDRNLSWISPSIEHYTGRSAHELLGTPAPGLLWPEDRPLLDEPRSRLLQGVDDMPHLEVRLIRADGNTRWMSMVAKPVLDASGGVRGIVGGLSDIHEQVALRRALRTLTGGAVALTRARDENELLGLICQVAVERGGYPGAWYGRAVDNDDQDVAVIAASEGAAPVLEGLHPSWGEGARGTSTSGRALRSGNPEVTTDYLQQTSHAPWREAAEQLGVRSAASFPLHVAGGVDGVLTVYAAEVDGFDRRAMNTLENLALELGFGIARLREQLRADEATRERDRTAHQLEQVARMESIGQIAGGIAHDFNNLLTVQLNYCTLLQGDLDDAERSGGNQELVAGLRDGVEHVADAARQAAELTHQLLTFARAKVAAAVPTDLNAIVRDTETLLRRVVPRSVSLRTDLAADLPQVKVDRARMTQVLMNLVVNACDAIGEEGAVTVATDFVPTESDGHRVRLRVTDDGSGMPPEVRDHAFEPFFTTKGPGRGTGLGLATVYGIVTQSGGSLEIQSEVGVGTTIEIFLETAGTTTTGSYETVLAEGRAKQSGSVLVVDDEDAVRSSTARLLLGAGYSATTCSGAEEALTLLRSGTASFDLLLTDLQMPGMSGLRLAELACDEQRDLRCLFVSGYADPFLEDATENRQFLQKPYSSDQLLAAVDNALRASDGASPAPS